MKTLLSNIVLLAAVLMMASCQTADNASMGAPATYSNNHEYVDLGLNSGTMWASMNIGAASAEQAGEYFAWGEIESKGAYTEASYKWFSESQISKYCCKAASNSTIDFESTLNAEDDAAATRWGANWRMPSFTQVLELINYCTWEPMDMNGVFGYNVVGPNGNSIFLPANGVITGENLDGENTMGGYWSRTISEENDTDAFSLSIDEDNVRFNRASRVLGMNIRPVCK